MTKIEEQILNNQLIIMGMLQDLNNGLEPIQSIIDTHNLIIEERKLQGE